MKKLFVLLIVFAVQRASASKAIGNGGNAVDCGQTVEILDVFEAKANDPRYAVTLEGETPKDKVYAFVRNLETVSPQRASYYRTLADHFLNTYMMTRDPVTEIKDYGNLHAAIPDGCRLVQIAVQRNYPFQRVPIALQISHSLFERLSENSKAALFVHEIVEAEASTWGAKDFTDVRPLVAWLISGRASPMNARTFIENSLAAGLFTYEYGGLVLTYGATQTDSIWPIFSGNKLVLGTTYAGKTLLRQNLILPLGGNIAFDLESRIESVCSVGGGKVSLGGLLVSIQAGDQVDLDTKGKVTRIVTRREDGSCQDQTADPQGKLALGQPRACTAREICARSAR